MPALGAAPGRGVPRPASPRAGWPDSTTETVAPVTKSPRVPRGLASVCAADPEHHVRDLRAVAVHKPAFRTRSLAISSDVRGASSRSAPRADTTTAFRTRTKRSPTRTSRPRDKHRAPDLCAASVRHKCSKTQHSAPTREDRATTRAPVPPQPQTRHKQDVAGPNTTPRNVRYRSTAHMFGTRTQCPQRGESHANPSTTHRPEHRAHQRVLRHRPTRSQPGHSAARGGARHHRSRGARLRRWLARRVWHAV